MGSSDNYNIPLHLALRKHGLSVFPGVIWSMVPRIRQIPILAALCNASIFIAACSGTFEPGVSDFSISFPVSEWEHATPESQGVDSERLADLVEALDRNRDDIDAVVLVRNGRLVFEAYRSPYTAEQPHRIYSCTKSIVSTLIGRAIDEKLIRSVDTPVTDLFPSLNPEITEEVSQDLTLEHFLTMTTGLDARDSYRYRWSGLQDLRESNDRTGMVLSRPQIHPPGDYFDYSNQASFLLGAAVSEATGMPANAWADRILFTPLGIQNYRWDLLSGGELNAWGGLWMQGRDLARIGWMVARKGRWNEEQIVSRKWIEEATRPRVEGRDLNDEYGYQWWVSSEGIPMAQGYGGQYLIVMPEENLVAVILSGLSEREFLQPRILFNKYIVPALAPGALPENPEGLKRLNQAATEWKARFELTDTTTTLEGEPPENLVEALNARYGLAENRRGLIAVEFSLKNDNLEYREEYEYGMIRYPVGINREFSISETDGLSYAFTAGWTDRGGLRMREYGLGQGYRNDYDIYFPDPGSISVRLKDSSGNTDILTGKVVRQP